MKLQRFQLAFLWLAGLLIAAPPLCCLSWFSRGNVVIPFKQVHGLMISAMSLNGKPGQNFIIDTGAFNTVLDVSAVNAEGLRTVSVHGTAHCVGGDVILSQTVPQATIFAYGFQINGGMDVLDLNSLEHLFRVPLTGIVGSDAITSRPILVDYQAGTITMFLGKHRPRLEKGAEKIPLESRPGADQFAAPVFPASLELPDGRFVKLNLEIDTGSWDALTLYPAFARKYGLLGADPKPAAMGYGCGGKYWLATASVPAIIIGNEKISDPKTLSVENATGAAASTEIDGVIGYRILSRFRIFIDAPEHFVVFEPPGK